jgi:predicted AlkP superfamily phosphohydrolase/phosphomutase/Flp pilus assembly protein TadD
MAATRTRGKYVVLLLLFALTLCGCSRATRPRAIVIGLDGLDPQAVDLLMSEGKLPNLARLRLEGAYGRLRSAKPLLSPVVWSTIATGKTPDQHGIGHFVALDEKGDPLPVTSGMRTAKAVWNILSEHDRRVGVVGWWATWPAEPVKGAVVSDHTCYHFLFPQASTGAGDASGLTHPPELLARIAPLIRRPADVTPDEAKPFLDVGSEELGRPFTFDDEVAHFKWALATADTYRAIGLKLWKEERPDLLLVYVEATDSLAHLFGHLFRAGPLAGELATQQAKHGRAVEAMYRWADRLVGEYLEAAGPETNVVVLSDHGFALGELPDDPSTTRDMRRVSERFHRLDGVLYLAGPDIRRGRLEQPTILDVAPTLLALVGLPPARDMPGRVLEEALRRPRHLAAVPTYETGAATARQRQDAEVTPEILERLQSLGYLGGAASPPSPPHAGEDKTRSPQSERTIAALDFEAGRPESAILVYEKLLREAPQDASLHTSLAGALGAVGRFDEALRHLDTAVRLNPLSVEAYHNRAVILERRGRISEAIEEYRKALRYRPAYAPSRRALGRLTGEADARAPKTAAEALAESLAQEAAAAARRGDYRAAMGRLAEAERIAPRYALVHQYQSNVAYLMGDHAAAIRALEKAVAIEPDNALFRTNLARLRSRPATAPRDAR